MNVRSTTVALVAGAVGALAPASALANTTAAVDGGVLRVQATDAAEDVGIYVSDPSTQTIVVSDLYRTVDAGPGCAPIEGGRAACPAPGIASVEAHLGAGDDALATAVGVPVRAYGEDGNDNLTGLDRPTVTARQPVLLDGGPGDDHIGGSAVDDQIFGGPGHDDIDGNGGNDFIDPGTGPDVVQDLIGDNHIEARDGEADSISCGSGDNVLVIDVIDTANGCGMQGQSATAPTDCTPEIGPVTSVALARLKRTRTITVRADAEAPCRLSARLTGAGRVLSHSAAGTARSGSLRLRLSSAATRHVRAGSHLRLTITSAAPGARTIKRGFSILVRHG